MTIDIDDLIDQLKNIKAILKENEKLKADLYTSRTLLDEYRSSFQFKAEEHQNMKRNFQGALKMANDEIDVLYRKLDTILNPEKPDNARGWNKRTALRELLDKIEPTDIKMGYHPYSLASAPRYYHADNYPEAPLRFC